MRDLEQTQIWREHWEKYQDGTEIHYVSNFLMINYIYIVRPHGDDSYAFFAFQVLFFTVFQEEGSRLRKTP